MRQLFRFHWAMRLGGTTQALFQVSGMCISCSLSFASTFRFRHTRTTSSTTPLKRFHPNPNSISLSCLSIDFQNGRGSPPVLQRSGLSRNPRNYTAKLEKGISKASQHHLSSSRMHGDLHFSAGYPPTLLQLSLRSVF